jgi:hypothetical protein
MPVLKGTLEMLLICPDFVSSEQAKEVIGALQQVTSAPLPPDVFANKLPNRTEVSGRIFGHIGMTEFDKWLTTLRQQILGEVRRLHGVSGPYYIDFTLLTEMKPGDYHALHADNVKQVQDGRWVPNHTPWREHTAMLYLNTSAVDYEGGLLRFPTIRQEIVPQVGLLVSFPCGQQYEHEVTAVQQGCRYAISIWFTRDPDHTESWS